MRALKFTTGHVIFKLHYNQIYQLKTTMDGTLEKNIMRLLNWIRHIVQERYYKNLALAA